MAICKVCGIEKTNIGVHALRVHKMSPEQYNDYVAAEANIVTDSTLEDEEEVVVEKDDSVATKSNSVVVNTDNVNKYNTYTIKQFCSEMAITMVELLSIVKDFKSGKPRNQLSILKNDLNKGMAEAESLKDNKEVRTSNSFVADALTKKFGFTVVRVDRSRGKTWVLKKQ